MSKKVKGKSKKAQKSNESQDREEKDKGAKHMDFGGLPPRSLKKNLGCG